MGKEVDEAYEEGFFAGTYSAVEQLCAALHDIPQSVCVQWRKALEEWDDIPWHARPPQPRLSSFLPPNNVG